MSQSFPTSNPEASASPKEQQTNDSETRYQRLMELVEAEDASNGEVGCGRDWGERLPVYLRTCGINISDDKLRTLLREHLGNVLMERDFDSIMTQVSRFIESVVVQVHSQSESPKPSPTQTERVTEHIPTAELRQSFQSELGEFCNDTDIEQIVQFTHQVIHQAVLHPRYTFSEPIWVLKGEEKIYIAQAKRVKEAIAKVREQNPEETGELNVVKVGGLLSPDQVISLEPTKI
ncbi:hypothetical protein [Coleofasciculus sp.]|uniref:hypothetical protein n=1 Tax=Coleofasciculus sp. TaxID=3100458 RepID=UPI003A4257EF